MTAPTNEYHFIDRWRVGGEAGEVASLIEDGEGLPRRWPSTYLDVRTPEPGGAGFYEKGPRAYYYGERGISPPDSLPPAEARFFIA